MAAAAALFHSETMKRTAVLSLVPLLLAGAAAIADDSMSRVTPSDHQTIKECMAQQKSNNVAQSKSEMKRYCKDQLKQQKVTGDTPAPPVDRPPDPATPTPATPP
jgi:hypothetical protein